MNLTMRQVAERIRLNIETVKQWRWRVRYNLPLHEAGRDLVANFFNVGRAVRMREEDLEDWIRAQHQLRRINSPGIPKADLELRLRDVRDELRRGGYYWSADAVALALKALRFRK